MTFKAHPFCLSLKANLWELQSHSLSDLSLSSIHQSPLILSLYMHCGQWWPSIWSLTPRSASDWLLYWTPFLWNSNRWGLSVLFRLIYYFLMSDYEKVTLQWNNLFALFSLHKETGAIWGAVMILAHLSHNLLSVDGSSRCLRINNVVSESSPLISPPTHTFKTIGLGIFLHDPYNCELASCSNDGEDTWNQLVRKDQNDLRFWVGRTVLWVVWNSF